MQKFNDALAAFAGLLGAAGVAAAAAAAHIGGGARLASVAMILLVHAAAVLALTARAKEPQGHQRIWLLSAFVLAFGATLFSADVALLTLRGARLFPMAAPTGGVTMIAGWLLASAAGLTGVFARHP